MHFRIPAKKRPAPGVWQHDFALTPILIIDEKGRDECILWLESFEWCYAYEFGSRRHVRLTGRTAAKYDSAIEWSQAYFLSV